MKETEVSASTPGLGLLPEVKFEHVHLTSFQRCAWILQHRYEWMNGRYWEVNEGVVGTQLMSLSYGNAWQYKLSYSPSQWRFISLKMRNYHFNKLMFHVYSQVLISSVSKPLQLLGRPEASETKMFTK